jgi:uncharacterized protein
VHVALIIKATRICNLRCTYCNDWRVGHNQIMTFPVMVAMTGKVLQDPQHDSVEFIWHGGEPTLLGRAFFEKAIHAQARLRRSGQTITNSLQTNATRLDEEWARFLRDNRFSVSISLDGPAFVHNRQRRHVSGRGSYADVLTGMEVLRHHGIPFSVLMVVDRETLVLGPDFVFDFFLDQDIKSYGLLAAKPKNVQTGDSGSSVEHYITPQQMETFLCRLFERWVTHGDATIQIREFSSLLRRLSGREASTCVLAGHCFGSYFLIEPHGETAHCDLFLGDPTYSLGNVVSHSFADFRSGPAMQALREHRREEIDAMRACPNFAICNGWCPHERYTALRHDPDFSRTCCGLSGLIDHIRSRILEQRGGLHGRFRATHT